MRLPHASKIGFTLLEVMVAVAILAISFTVLLTFSGNTMIKSGRAEKMLTATMLARQKMTEIEIDLAKAIKKNEFPEEKSDEGKFDDPFDEYSWKMEIKRVELPAPVTGEKGSMQETIGRQLTKEISKTVRELKLTVKWEEMGEEQSFDVVTHIVKL
ncbi:MAG: type II secretion system protein [bacterium]